MLPRICHDTGLTHPGIMCYIRDHADYTAPTRQHEIDHTDHTDHTDQEIINLP